MPNITAVSPMLRPILAAGLCLMLGAAGAAPQQPKASPMIATTTLSARQAAIPLIAAAMATSDMPRLRTALTAGLDAGLTVSEAKEILIYLYAYAGFPRSLRWVN
jgi:4-carboxymuconolactone decarboxylase